MFDKLIELVKRVMQCSIHKKINVDINEPPCQQSPLFLLTPEMLETLAKLDNMKK